MQSKPRPFQADDLQRMLDLLDRCRKPERLRDFPGRADLQEAMSLGSVRGSARLWDDRRGRLTAFAYVDAYDNLRFEFDRGEKDVPPVEEIVGWGVHWARHGAGRPIDRLDTSCGADDLIRIGELERCGFTRLPLQTLSLIRDLSGGVEESRLPVGFRTRQAGGNDETEALVELHRAAFGTTHMTAEELRAIRRSEGYDRALDLVVEADDGQLASFCLSRSEDRGAREGSIDSVGTRPEFRRRGLARALLLQSSRLLSERGVRLVRLGTSSENDGMLRAAASAGFVPGSRVNWYARPIPAAL